MDYSYDDAVQSMDQVGVGRYEGLTPNGDEFVLHVHNGVTRFENKTTNLSASKQSPDLSPADTGFQDLIGELFSRTEEMDEEREAAAMDEVQNIMAECFGFGIAMDAIADLRDAAPQDWAEGHEHGFTDTVVREALMSHFSTMLMGMPVPTSGEAQALNFDTDVFFHTAKVAHDEQYGEQPLPYWMS